MAIFNKWHDWQAMARDLQDILRSLTIKDNIAPTEFAWKDWDVRVSPDVEDVALGVSDIRSRYLLIGKTCWFNFYFVLTCSADVAYVKINTPVLPSETRYHASNKLATTTNGAPYNVRIRNATVSPVVAVSHVYYVYSDEVIVIPYDEKLIDDFTTGNTYVINGFGFYEVD